MKRNQMKFIYGILFFCHCLLSISISGLSQSYQADSLKIDSLKNALQSHKQDTTGVRILRKIADLYLRMEDRNHCEQYAQQEEDLAAKIGDDKGKAVALETLGIVLELKNKIEQARKNYTASLNYYRQIGDKAGVAGIYEHFASTYNEESNGPEALKYTYEALKMYQELENKQAIANTSLGLGFFSIEAHDYPKADEFLTMAQKTFAKLGDRFSIALVESARALINNKQGNYAEALKHDSISLGLYNEVKEVFDKGAVYLDMAECNEKLGDELSVTRPSSDASNKYLEALDQYFSAVSVYKKASKFNSTSGFINSCYANIGNLYVKLHRNDSASFFLDKSLQYYSQLTPELKATDAGDLQMLYLALSRLDSAKGNPGKAYENFKESRKYREMILAKEEAKKLQQMTMQYEFDSKTALAKADEVRKDSEQRRIKNQQYFIIASLGLIVLAAIIISLIQFRNNRQKKRANLRLEQEKEKVEKALSDLKITQSQLIQSEKMASLGELTAGIAHEIQNPLNFINNFSEVNTELIADMRAELHAGNIQEAIAISNSIEDNENKITQHGKRADGIVKGMLLHSRTGIGERVLADINAVVDECLKLSYHNLRAKDKSFGVQIHSDYDQSIGKFQFVPQDMATVFVNLFNNAFYAVGERKKTESDGYMPFVSVSTVKADDMVTITVKDNGNGIPPKIIDKIFQPFFTTKPTGQGTGLGLSLSYDIVKAHGGQIKANANENGGSKFTIEIPSL